MKDLVLSPESLLNQQKNLQQANVLLKELINASVSKYELGKLYEVQNLIHKAMLSEQSLYVLDCRVK
ncbi:MAG: hypothetical protein WCX96_04560 [Bacilli bacterium]